MFQNCKCLMKKMEKKTDLNKSVVPSPSVIGEKNEPCIVDKDNCRYNELEGTTDYWKCGL
jgi:hypothetical protein